MVANNGLYAGIYIERFHHPVHTHAERARFVHETAIKHGGFVAVLCAQDIGLRVVESHTLGRERLASAYVGRTPRPTPTLNVRVLSTQAQRLCGDTACARYWFACRRV